MTELDRRPDPDALLARLEAEQVRVQRPKLKIFLGYAPGVGKTYKMLETSRALLEDHVDLVVGAIETHGRYDTAALMLGLEILPRRIIAYRGLQLEEFDLEAALARRPRVLLLDELAHSNVPGGRHAKRWQDVEDLLAAGIEVHTTLNIQHVESLNDVIAQITTVRVRETVPDSSLARADELEVVDLPPEELLVRLSEGKVYLPNQAARAMQHFFQKGNLLALRELALRRAAERVNADVEAYRRQYDVQSTWPTAERLLVCVGSAPSSARLIRTASRLASVTRSPWVAASAQVAGAAPLAAADRERLEAHLRLAESLGAEVVRLTGVRASHALIDYARRHNVTRIVLGKPTHSRLKDVLFGSMLDEVVRASGEIDVTAISGGPESAPEEAAGPVAPRSRLAPYLWSAGLVALATATGTALWAVLALPDIVMLYTVAIMLVAVWFEREASILAAALSVSAYDFFFVEPYYTFAVGDLRHVLTFAMMFVVGLVISTLTLRIRHQVSDARLREQSTASLYALSRELSAAIDEEQATLAIAQHAADVFEGGAAVLLPGPDGGLTAAAKSGPDIPLGDHPLSLARWVLEHGRLAGRGTDTLPGAGLLCAPLTSGSRPLGVLALLPGRPEPPGAEQRHFLEAFGRQAALALERARLAEKAKAVALRARAEEMRNSLLSAVSHDLRTPLAAITGAATALRLSDTGLSSEQTRELVDTVCEESERMERLLTNLLDMTRLGAGNLELKREWVPLDEVVGSAVTRLEKRLAGRPLQIRLGDSPPLISVDPVLLEQVLVNLLENALKYTPELTPIELTASVRGKGLSLEVSDRGPGLPPGAEARLFEKFVRGPSPGVPGVGLGLSICQGIVQAHGGTLEAANRPEGGAVFRMTLPQDGAAPVLPQETLDPEGAGEVAE